MKVTLVGDIHGKVKEFLQIVEEAKNPVVQLGDFGFGFISPTPKLPKNAFFIRGNHDSPVPARRAQGYLGDYGTVVFDKELPPKKKVFFLSGAFSIDREWRVEDESWWADEELSYPELADAINLYELIKPDIVLTHEAPSCAVKTILDMFKLRDYKIGCAFSRTSVALQQMLEVHKPALWVFGHYHLPGDFNLFGTRFVCLPELQTMEIEI